MRIQGLQKLTLLDYPEKTACTLFTAGCNFRCPFCHNAALVTHIDNSNFFTEEYVLDYLKKRKGVLDGVCITGGEPLLHKDLPEFIKKVKALGYLIKLDTNGSYPERLQSLIDDGLIDYVAMDIKNTHEKYLATADCSDDELQNVIKSVEILKQNKIDYEFRTTVVKEYHDAEDIKKIAANMLAVLKKRLASLEITAEFDESALTAIADAGFDKVYGARPLRRAIQSKIEDALSEKLLDGSIKNGDTVVCKFNEDFEFVSE